MRELPSSAGVSSAGGRQRGRQAGPAGRQRARGSPPRRLLTRLRRERDQGRRREEASHAGLRALPALLLLLLLLLEQQRGLREQHHHARHAQRRCLAVQHAAIVAICSAAAPHYWP